MEPRIQYAKTEDGVDIAFRVLGKGMPFVQTLVPGSDLRLHWEIPEVRTWYERLAEKRMLVQYDNRGTGLSQRDVTGFSLEALGCDIEAVADRLGLERFALWGTQNMGPVAIAYAARHPERVSHLILWCSYARASDMLKSPQAQALARLVDNWELFTDTAAHYNWGWSGGEAARLLAVRMREGVTQKTYWALLGQLLTADVADLLPTIRAPTLVLHRRRFPQVSVDVATDLASRIPNAQLVLLEGESGNFTLENGQAVLDAIDEFLSEGEEAEPKSELPEGMAVILFADIVESTALTEEMGDAAFRAKARELDTSLREIIRETGGTPVEGQVLGDGVLAVFTSARQAIECALRCGAAGEPLGLHLHLGIHAGDVIREGNNVYGGAVNIAARIAGASAPGEVLVSDTVRGLARTSAGVSFDDRGEQTLKGIAEPQRLFAVRAREGGA
jgi:class 3 adenylate cyclase